MPGTLYIVATPIGNLDDLTQRALSVLRQVDVIACEDTRHTRKLLTHFGIDARTVSYHEHNETSRATELADLLTAGRDVAVVSDAGTPLISDPGFRIVRAAIERGISIVPIPGASAFVTALAASGLASDQIFFGGFLPARATARRIKLEEIRSLNATVIFYEAPHRIAGALRDAHEVLGNRPAVVARELTKLHEEFARGTLSELANLFSDANRARGEVVLMIAGADSVADIDDQSGTESISSRFAKSMVQLQEKGLDEKTALKQAARELGLKRDEAYRLLVAQKNRRQK